MKLRVYIDTSVIGGCLDDKFSDPSKRLMAQFKLGKMIAIVSDITLKELVSAPIKVKQVIEDIFCENIEKVSLTDEVIELSELYMAEKVVSHKEMIDARHIAIATIHHANVLVSWNFKHIVNLKRILGYNSVNLKNGYPQLEIRTPQEVIEYAE